MEIPPRGYANFLCFGMCALGSFFTVRAARDFNPVDVIYAIGFSISGGVICCTLYSTREVGAEPPERHNATRRVFSRTLG